MANRKVVVAESLDSIENLGILEEDEITIEDAFVVKSIEVDDSQQLDVELNLPSGDDDYRAVEDLDDNEPIWEGGPVAGEIKEWKDQYGDIYVTSITFDKHIVWRVLNRVEYKQIVKKMEQLVQAGQLTSAEANMWNEETIAEMCILYPKYDKRSLSGVMAGLPSLIAQEVLEASGFVALEVRQL
jgi:hypothetical protein